MFFTSVEDSFTKYFVKSAFIEHGLASKTLWILMSSSVHVREDSKGPTKQLEILYNQALYE